MPVLKHSLDLISDSKLEIANCHSNLQNKIHDFINLLFNFALFLTYFEGQKKKSLISTEDILNKPRHSEYPMISVDESVSIVLSKSDLLDTENIFYLDSIGRISAGNV